MGTLLTPPAEDVPPFVDLRALVANTAPLNLGDFGDIAQTAALILKDGLQRPLQVLHECDNQGQRTGRYVVIKDRHRLLALQRLASQGKIFPDIPVPCR